MTVTDPAVRNPSLTATCHDAGCPNFEIPILMQYTLNFPPAAAQCGPCSRILYDVAGLPGSSEPVPNPTEEET